MADMQEIATGLQFPEGPIAMDDGSVLLVEIQRQTLTRVTPDGQQTIVAELGGGPNGAAIGPDGMVYVTNDGGCFEWHEMEGFTVPGNRPESYIGGRIQRVDPATGEFEDIYTECDDKPLRAPNDLVFDTNGGFWFTDHGTSDERSRDRTGVYYAQPDGSSIEEVIFPTDGPNGVGLSPDGSTLYYAETHTGRVMRIPLDGPGKAAPPAGLLDTSRLLVGLPGMQLLDSLAIDGDGNICVATLIQPGITVISPVGEVLEKVETDDPLTTNICFGGPDLRTAYITLSGLGKLVSMEWPRPGLKLAYTA